ncbi:MAG: SGNH/GDSL hydrolase family protein [Acidobacteriota bacterium]|nr:SGNH/GDSL hydrolase family protein [Acidobacteriota bacterium]
MATWMTANTDLANPVEAALSVDNHFATEFNNQTIREIVHTTIGGRAVRIRLSNKFGTKPIRFDPVFIGIQKEGAAVVAGSNHAVTFSGAKTVSIPEGGEVLSDEIALAVSAQQNLAVSLYIAAATGPATIHHSAFQTNYLSDTGDFSDKESSEAFSKTMNSWYFLQEVDVAGGGHTGAIVALGDSITDGASAGTDAYDRWTDVLARRLNGKLPVLNAGIGGNRVLSSSPCFGENAFARLDRDVFAPAGVRTVILFEGTNDIGQPDTPVAANAKYAPCMAKTHVSADDLIAGYKQIIMQAHARHLRIMGATILPYQGFKAWNEKGEATRVTVNRWIKEAGAFDGVIDFSAALSDKEIPTKLAAEFDSGDHLHPNSAGHEAMARAIDLKLFSEP